MRGCLFTSVVMAVAGAAVITLVWLVDALFGEDAALAVYIAIGVISAAVLLFLRP